MFVWCVHVRVCGGCEERSQEPRAPSVIWQMEAAQPWLEQSWEKQMDTGDT